MDVPKNFALGLGEGMELLKASDLSEEQIQLYEQRMKTWGNVVGDWLADVQVSCAFAVEVLV